MIYSNKKIIINVYILGSCTVSYKNRCNCIPAAVFINSWTS